ncbi:hypothetical protein BJX96DRAFT_128893 [Aspergillus floccosus]
MFASLFACLLLSFHPRTLRTSTLFSQRGASFFLWIYKRCRPNSNYVMSYSSGSNDHLSRVCVLVASIDKTMQELNEQVVMSRLCSPENYRTSRRNQYCRRRFSFYDEHSTIGQV